MWRHFHQIDWIAEINGDFIMFTNSLFPVLHLVIHFGEILVSSSEVENISDLLSTSNCVHVLVNHHLRINGLFCLMRNVYVIFLYRVDWHEYMWQEKALSQFLTLISCPWIGHTSEKLHEIRFFLSFLFWKNFLSCTPNDKISHF